MGMAILTENFILLKNSTVRSIIHDGRSYGVLRGAIFHCVLSSVITVAGLAMVQPACCSLLALARAVRDAILHALPPAQQSRLQLHGHKPQRLRLAGPHPHRHCTRCSRAEGGGCAGQVQWIAPAAAGAGVSLVIAYLNGNAVPDLLNWRSLLVKWAGTICSVSGNLTFGPEAPMVHLGACTAHLATHFVSGEAHPADTAPVGMLVG